MPKKVSHKGSSPISNASLGRSRRKGRGGQARYRGRNVKTLKVSAAPKVQKVVSKAAAGVAASPKAQKPLQGLPKEETKSKTNSCIEKKDFRFFLSSPTWELTPRDREILSTNSSNLHNRALPWT